MSESSTTTSVLFGTSFMKPLVARFDQSQASSDAGALLLRPLDDRLGITQALADALPDSRDPSRVQHSQLDLVRQRVYAIACGYEDGNDASRLRHDPTQLLLLGRDPLAGQPLGSQPTLSRFENRHALRNLIAGAEAIADAIIASHARRLGRRAKRIKRITIDYGGTVDPAYGNQQGVLFNAYHDQHCLSPLLQRARVMSAATGESARVYSDTLYQADTWSRERRLVIKAEVTRYLGREARDNPRFAITNLKGRPEAIYRRIYAPRGDMENRIKGTPCASTGSPAPACTRTNSGYC